MDLAYDLLHIDALGIIVHPPGKRQALACVIIALYAIDLEVSVRQFIQGLDHFRSLFRRCGFLQPYRPCRHYSFKGIHVMPPVVTVIRQAHRTQKNEQQRENESFHRSFFVSAKIRFFVLLTCRNGYYLGIPPFWGVDAFYIWYCI